MGILSIIWGGLVDDIIYKRWEAKKRQSIWIRFWSGLAMLSFILCLICFFTPLTPLVKAIVWLALLSPIFLKQNLWSALFSEVTSKFKSMGIFSLLLVILGSGIALLKASGKPEIFDEGAYHLPLIRMWENEGMVLGMANLNGHYGLNSTWHILSAFSNLSFLPLWKTEMALNGLVAVVLSFYAASRLNAIWQGSKLISHWIVVLLPFFVFRNLLSSPSTDIPAIVCTWFVFTIWLETIEKEQSPWEVWPIFTLLPFWIVILKASSAALLFIPAGILFLAIVENDRKKITAILSLGAAMMFPWIIQNWLLTGYAVFPIRKTALGHPIWQVPLESIDKKFYLAQFGNFAPPDSYTLSWFIHWLQAHNVDSRVIIILSFSTILAWFVLFIFRAEQRVFLKVFLFSSVMACVLSWFITITEPRYGFGALVFSALFFQALFLSRLQSRFPIIRNIALLILVLQTYNLFKTYLEFSPGSNIALFPSQAPKVKFKTLHCGNFEAITPVSYLSVVPSGKPVFCWDCPFPCIPKEGSIDSTHIFKLNDGLYSGYYYR